MVRRIPFPHHAFLLGIIALSGCSGIGPVTMVPARFDYARAIGDSWKQQMLMNAVKMRYGDPPVFLDVASIISQFEVSGNVNLGGALFNQASGNHQSINSSTNFADPVTGALNLNAMLGSPYISSTHSIGGSGNYVDRPTITYSPLNGEKLTRTLMRPIPPTVVLSMVEAGYSIDLVMRFCVRSINGIRNRYGGATMTYMADRDFYPLLNHLLQIQTARALTLRASKSKEIEGVYMTFHKDVDPGTNDEINAVLSTLRLNPAVEEFRVAHGAVARTGDEIAILSRSMLEIISDLSSIIEVPLEHVRRNRVTPTAPDDWLGSGTVPPLIRIRSSRLRPVSAYLAVPYENHWFYIDDEDIQSKKLFAFLMMIFSLNDTDDPRGFPIITIPSG